MTLRKRVDPRVEDLRRESEKLIGQARMVADMAFDLLGALRAHEYPRYTVIDGAGLPMRVGGSFRATTSRVGARKLYQQLVRELRLGVRRAPGGRWESLTPTE